MAPDTVIQVSQEIVSGRNYLESTVNGCKKAVELISKAMEEGRLKDDAKETAWIPMIQAALETIPSDESQFIEEMMPVIDREKISMSEYGL
jgi:hypothetical protein